MRQEGIVLVLLLLFLFLLSLLALMGLSTSQLEIKMATHYQLRQNIFFEGERSLTLAEKSLNERCLLPRAGIDDYPMRSNSWWLSSVTCHITSERYFTAYIIEKLELASCSRIINAPQMLPRFYRITVYSDLLTKSSPIKLQSTFVKPEKSQERCERKTLSTITTGRQSWYEW